MGLHVVKMVWLMYRPTHSTLQLGGREIFLREDREDFELTGSSGSRSTSFRADRGGASGRGPASQSGVAVIGRRLFVNNLSPETTWQRLKDYFRICGNVVYTDVFAVSSEVQVLTLDALLKLQHGVAACG